ATRDGRTFAAAGSNWHHPNERVHRWDAATLRKLPPVGKIPDQIGTLAFSPDGSLLATGSADSVARVWRLSDGESFRWLRHRGWVQGVAFAPHAPVLAVAAGHTVRLWDYNTGDELAALAGHRQTVCSVAYAPDGRTLLSASKDGSVRLWDAATGAAR